MNDKKIFATDFVLQSIVQYTSYIGFPIYLKEDSVLSQSPLWQSNCTGCFAFTTQ